MRRGRGRGRYDKRGRRGGRQGRDGYHDSFYRRRPRRRDDYDHDQYGRDGYGYARRGGPSSRRKRGFEDDKRRVKSGERKDEGRNDDRRSEERRNDDRRKEESSNSSTPRNSKKTERTKSMESRKKKDWDSQNTLQTRSGYGKEGHGEKTKMIREQESTRKKKQSKENQEEKPSYFDGRRSTKSGGGGSSFSVDRHYVNRKVSNSSMESVMKPKEGPPRSRRRLGFEGRRRNEEPRGGRYHRYPRRNEEMEYRAPNRRDNAKRRVTVRSSGTREESKKKAEDTDDYQQWKPPESRNKGNLHDRNKRNDLNRNQRSERGDRNERNPPSVRNKRDDSKPSTRRRQDDGHYGSHRASRRDDGYGRTRDRGRGRFGRRRGGDGFRNQRSQVGEKKKKKEKPKPKSKPKKKAKSAYPDGTFDIVRIGEVGSDEIVDGADLDFMSELAEMEKLEEQWAKEQAEKEKAKKLEEEKKRKAEAEEQAKKEAEEREKEAKKEVENFEDLDTPYVPPPVKVTAANIFEFTESKKREEEKKRGEKELRERRKRREREDRGDLWDDNIENAAEKLEFDYRGQVDVGSVMRLAKLHKEKIRRREVKAQKLRERDHRKYQADLDKLRKEEEEKNEIKRRKQKEIQRQKALAVDPDVLEEELFDKDSPEYVNGNVLEVYDLIPHNMRLGSDFDTELFHQHKGNDEMFDPRKSPRPRKTLPIGARSRNPIHHHIPIQRKKKRIVPVRKTDDDVLFDDIFKEVADGLDQFDTEKENKADMERKRTQQGHREQQNLVIRSEVEAHERLPFKDPQVIPNSNDFGRFSSSSSGFIHKPHEQRVPDRESVYDQRRGPSTGSNDEDELNHLLGNNFFEDKPNPDPRTRYGGPTISPKKERIPSDFGPIGSPTKDRMPAGFGAIGSPTKRGMGGYGAIGTPTKRTPGGYGTIGGPRTPPPSQGQKSPNLRTTPTGRFPTFQTEKGRFPTETGRFPTGRNGFGKSFETFDDDDEKVGLFDDPTSPFSRTPKAGMGNKRFASSSLNEIRSDDDPIVRSGHFPNPNNGIIGGNLFGGKNPKSSVGSGGLFGKSDPFGAGTVRRDLFSTSGTGTTFGQSTWGSGGFSDNSTFGGLGPRIGPGIPGRGVGLGLTREDDDGEDILNDVGKTVWGNNQEEQSSDIIRDQKLEKVKETGMNPNNNFIVESSGSFVPPVKIREHAVDNDEKVKEELIDMLGLDEEKEEEEEDKEKKDGDLKIIAGKEEEEMESHDENVKKEEEIVNSFRLDDDDDDDMVDMFENDGLISFQGVLGRDESDESDEDDLDEDNFNDTRGRNQKQTVDQREQEKKEIDDELQALLLADDDKLPGVSNDLPEKGFKSDDEKKEVDKTIDDSDVKEKGEKKTKSVVEKEVKPKPIVQSSKLTYSYDEMLKIRARLKKSKMKSSLKINWKGVQKYDPNSTPAPAPRKAANGRHRGRYYSGGPRYPGSRVGDEGDDNKNDNLRKKRDSKTQKSEKKRKKSKRKGRNQDIKRGRGGEKKKDRNPGKEKGGEKKKKDRKSNGDKRKDRRGDSKKNRKPKKREEKKRSNNAPSSKKGEGKKKIEKEKGEGKKKNLGNKPNVWQVEKKKKRDGEKKKGGEVEKKKKKETVGK